MPEGKFRSRLDERIFLNALNEGLSAEDLASIVRDDPEYGVLAGRGLSVRAASNILEYRKNLPGQAFRDPADVTKAPGVGDDTHHDLIVSFVRLPLARKISLFLSTENDLESFTALIKGVEPRVFHAILEYRSQQPGGVVSGIEELVERHVIEPEARARISEAFKADETRSRALDRLDLSVELKARLKAREGKASVRASDSVGEAVALLRSELPRDEAGVLERIYSSAIATGGARKDERVADVVYFPIVADHIKAGPPPGLLDPASIPGVSTDYGWVKTGAGVIVEPLGEGRLEILAPDGWSEGLTVTGRVYIEPTPAGIVVRGGGGGLMSAVGRTDTLMAAPAPAVWITCRGGIRGKLLGGVESISGAPGADTVVPSGWEFPGREIWINPVPGLPPLKTDPSREGGCLPTGVVIGGERHPPDPGDAGGEDAEPAVVVGFGPQVMIASPPRLPFPFIPGLPPPYAPWDFEGRPKPPKGGGWPGGLVYYDDGGDAVLTVRINGCQCIRRPESSRYTAEPSIEGGTYEWSVDDDEIAEIEGPSDQKECRLRSKKIGKLTLIVKYTKGGQSVQCAMGIAVIYHRFTPRNQPRAEKKAMPVIEPAPKVRITPSPDYTLEAGAIDIAGHRAQFFLDIDGRLMDALVDIESVEVLAGRSFRRRLTRGHDQFGGFDDNQFRAKRIEVSGPGRSYVRVKAVNSVGFTGTDTMELVIRIADAWEQIISRLEQSRQLMIDTGAAQAQIDGYDNRLRSAWESALMSATCEFGYLEHVDNTVSRAPGSEKWSIAVEADDKSGTADIATSSESQSVVLKERSSKLLVPKNEPKNYFLLHENYSRDRFNWDRDGRLLHRPGEPVSLVYLDPCCGHPGPGIGVELETPGVCLIDKDEPIRVKARGLPPAFAGASGRYTFKCIAHPRGATFRFDPETMPTAADAVNFLTDTPGVYTFKVEYQLLDAAGPWTHAVADAQIVLKVKALARVHRLGGYDGELAVHRDRPYYRERTVREQRGAEIRVSGEGGGPLGQDLEFLVLCPQELYFADTLQAKVTYADNTDRTFALHVDQRNRFAARLALRSPLAIQHVDIIGIQYGDIQRSVGDAVWIDVQVKPLEPEIVDLAPAAAPPSASSPPPAAGAPSGAASTPIGGTVVMVVDDPVHGAHEEEIELSRPVVNLILRTRDLGPAAACNGVVSLAPFVSETNVTNGNQFFDLLLFTMQGVGLSHSPSLHYNSKSATRAQAVRLYGELNGKNQDALDEEFGTEYCADGWGVTFHTQLIPFIDPEGAIDSPRLRRCVELLAINGNRLVFEEDGAPGTYKVRSDAECMGDHCCPR